MYVYMMMIMMMMIGEFIDLTDRLCNVNDTAVSVLHIIGIIIAVISQCLSYHAIYHIITKAATRLGGGGGGAGGGIAAHNNNNPNNNGNSSHGAHHGAHHSDRNGHHNRYSWIWHAIVTNPASLIGTYCIGYTIFALLYHIIRLTGGHGSELFASWTTTIIVMLALTWLWGGAAHFCWMIIKHTTASMQLERGSLATQASLNRFRFFCRAFGIVGFCGTLIAVVFARLANNSDQQTIALTLFFFAITISGTIVVISLFDSCVYVRQ
jgi:hypothetical protein